MTHLLDGGAVDVIGRLSFAGDHLLCRRPRACQEWAFAVAHPVDCAAIESQRANCGIRIGRSQARDQGTATARSARRAGADRTGSPVNHRRVAPNSRRDRPEIRSRWTSNPLRHTRTDLCRSGFRVLDVAVSPWLAPLLDAAPWSRLRGVSSRRPLSVASQPIVPRTSRDADESLRPRTRPRWSSSENPSAIATNALHFAGIDGEHR